MRSYLLSAILILTAACSHRELSPIRLVPMLTLGADSGDGAMATTPMVSARHPAGFRIVVPAFGAFGSLPLVFDDAGTYLGSLHGDTTASSPAYNPLFTRIGPGDSLWIFDNARRVHIFDAARRYIRSITLSSLPLDPDRSLTDAVVLPDNRFAATTNTIVAVQVLSPAGRVEREFGAPDSAGAERSNSRHIARAPDGTLWTATNFGRIEQWDTAGSLLAARQPAAWLKDSYAAERVRRHTLLPPDLPPPPALIAIWFDAAARLWLLGRVADRRWREGITRSDSNASSHIDSDKYYDSIVEVRDPRTGDLIASARFDVHCASIAEPGVLVHEVVTRAGWVRAELLRVVFDESALSKKR